MRVRDFECRTYEQAAGLLKGKDRRMVTNNTELIGAYDEKRTLYCVLVLLHEHPIVILHADGRTMVYSGGYSTAATQDRINRCLPKPWVLSQVDHKWVLWQLGTPQSEIPFENGMIVPTN